MPFPPTPSNSPSNTPTPSITPSNTPVITPTGTVCPGATPTMTPTISVTPSNTATNTPTPSITASNTNTPTQTSTPTKTPNLSPSPTASITPTPSATYECLCFTSATVNVTVAGNITFNDCNGNPTIENFGVGNNQIYGDGTFCIQKDTNGGTAEYTIVSYNTCCVVEPTPTPTVTPTMTQTQTPSATIGSTPTQTQTLTPSPTACNNVTAVFGYMEPCIGGTIDDHMGADVQVQNNVSVDTTFEVYVYYQTPGGSCNPATNLQQYFQITIPAGSSTGNFNACSSGAYFPSGAVICDSCIISCDNPSICISASFLC